MAANDDAAQKLAAAEAKLAKAESDAQAIQEEASKAVAAAKAEITKVQADA
jgi:hypothetical protein